MRRFVPLLALIALLLVPAAAPAADTDLKLGDDPRIEAKRLTVTVIGDWFDFPKALAEGPERSLLVGVNAPKGGSFFDSTGAIQLWKDENRDGIVDGQPVTLIDGIPGPIVEIAVADDLIFVTSVRYGAEAIYVLRATNWWDNGVDQVGQISLSMPNTEHQSYGLAVRKINGEPDAWELYFNLGAKGNDTGGGTITLSGLTTGSLPDSSIARVEVRDDGATVTVSPPQLIATGLRNSAAFRFDPVSGDLFLTDNGIDDPDNPIEPLSADELNRIPASQLGVNVVDFGFPQSYIVYRTGERVGESAQVPTVVFQPIGKSQGEGASSLTFVPKSFPGWLSGKILVGFHGQFDKTANLNEENPVWAIDPSTGEYVEFVANKNFAVGHIDSMVTIGDTIYMADLCSHGSLQAQAPCGVIYAVQAKP